VQVHHHEAATAEHVGVLTDDLHPVGAVERAAGIERQRALEEVVVGVAVEERPGADEDQALVPVGDVEIRVQRMDRSFLVLGEALAERVHRERRRRRYRCRVPRLHVQALAEG
jgi:hypothetical protein